MNFKLGEEVTVLAKIAVEKTHYKRKLVREEIKRREGIVVGVRTMREGHTEVEVDEGAIFYPSKYIRVVLVALSMGHMVRVLPEDLENSSGNPPISNG